MRKNHIRDIVMHIPDNINICALADKMNRCHVDIIERKLSQSDLTIEEKLCVIDRIIKDLKLRENNGIIR